MVAHSRYISFKLFEVYSNVLFAQFAACTYEVDLLTIETANNLTKFYPCISPLSYKHKCKVVGKKGAAKVIVVCNF